MQVWTTELCGVRVVLCDNYSQDEPGNGGAKVCIREAANKKRLLLQEAPEGSCQTAQTRGCWEKNAFCLVLLVFTFGSMLQRNSCNYGKAEMHRDNTVK